MNFHARLRHAFLAALCAPAASACGGTTTQGEVPDGSSGDGSTALDASNGHDSSSPGDASAPMDASEADSTHARPVTMAASPDADVCMSFVLAPCGYDGGPLTSLECQALCAAGDDAGGRSYSCFGQGPTNSSYIGCSYCAIGRRPERLGAAPPIGVTAGSLFAHCAWLEAASVHAFRRLADELSAHGAGADRVARALRAAQEEVAHARVTRRLARRFGVQAPRPRGRRLMVRALADIARENAVEGCVREAFGALVAMWQAQRAADPEVRRALAAIARDEAGHAELAWEVAAWIEPQLSDDVRAEIDEARRTALQTLRAEVAEELSREQREVAGMPGAQDALRMLESLEAFVVQPLSRAA